MTAQVSKVSIIRPEVVATLLRKPANGPFALRPLQWNYSSMKISWRTISVLLLSSALVGCATAAWKKYPQLPLPAFTCSFQGAEAAQRFYVWKCLDRKRIVIEQTSGMLGRSSAKRYESACDGKTEADLTKKLSEDDSLCSAGTNWNLD